ncbi:hypothetical protein, partial [Rhizobium ecuadorense]|uniref:hypothetical protein n=1 Tax=Rhizobium ecuadorense TaxID=1671795 RepID=UPI001AEBFBD8
MAIDNSKLVEVSVGKRKATALLRGRGCCMRALCGTTRDRLLGGERLVDLVDVGTHCLEGLVEGE